MAPPLLALVGPTASGKTEAAIVLAERLGAEIVSVDSMLVYRGMDVGTAKPDRRQRARVPHHLLDVAEPAGRFTVATFQALARDAVAGIRTRGASPLLVGGSGLYFRAIVDELTFPPEDPETRGALETEVQLLGAGPLHERLARLDPVAASRIEPGNARRTIRALEVAATTGRRFSDFGDAWDRHDPHVVRVAGVRLPAEILRRRIEARVTAMLDADWLGEVEALVERGFGDWLTSTQAIGYAEFARHLEGRLSLADAVEATVRRTRNLARRQMAWFRRDPRIRWFEVGEAGASQIVDELRSYLGASVGSA